MLKVSFHPFFPTTCADESQQFMTPKKQKRQSSSIFQKLVPSITQLI